MQIDREFTKYNELLFTIYNKNYHIATSCGGHVHVHAS